MHCIPHFAVGLLILTGCSATDAPASGSPALTEVADSAGESAGSDTGNVEASTATIHTAQTPSADGVVIRYDVRGENHGADRPTLVFVHGWCCNRTFWALQTARFADEYQVVAIDLAGHGQSDAGRENWTIEAFGRDVAAVVNTLGAERVILVGHSMGGPVILEAVAILGEKVVALFPVDALTDPNETYTREQMDGFRKTFEADFPKAVKGALYHEHQFFSDATTDALKERITAAMTSAAPDMGVAVFQAMLDFANDRQRPLMTQVKVPFVCINSKRDQTKVDDGKQHAPQFEVVTLPNSGHFLMMEHPDEFNDLLGKLIRENVGK
jgi:pimeloyl-ACP methyl ester carboxylesterase